MRERVVEAYLCKCVKRRGGEVRKVKWVGRHGAPDRYIMLPDIGCVWIELKRPKRAVLQSHQEREHVRMRKCGAWVEVLDSVEAIDLWFVMWGSHAKS